MMNATFSQEEVFNNREADAWFRRNSVHGLEAVSSDHRVLKALKRVDIPQRGVMLDIGGAAGSVAAGFKRDHPDWECYVIEPSVEAIAAGKQTFLDLNFIQGSICQIDEFSQIPSDIVVVSGVFCWVDRLLLTRAVCNVDQALKVGGLLVISDFDSPFLRANPYKHHEGLYTYKQNYSDIFKQLGTYHLMSHNSECLSAHTAYDSQDSYDCQWSTSVLRKDPVGRYFRSA